MKRKNKQKQSRKSERPPRPPAESRSRPCSWLLLLPLLIICAAMPLTVSPYTMESGEVRKLLLASALPFTFLLMGFADGGLLTRRIWWAIAAFLGVHLLSLGLCSGSRIIGLQECWRVLTLIGVMIYAAAFRERRRRWLLTAVVAPALGVALYAVFQKLGHDPIGWSSSAAGRVFSTIGNPNMLAAYCIGIIPIAVCAIPNAKSRLWKAILAFTSASLLLALIFTQCRGAVPGLLAAGGFLVLRFWRAWNLKVRWSVLFACLLGAVVLMQPVIKRSAEWNAVGEKKVGTTNVRLVIWRGAWKIFASNPVLGGGPGTFHARFPSARDPDYLSYGVTHNTKHAHCEYLEIMAELGVFGLAAFVFLLSTVLRPVFRKQKDAEADDSLLIGLIAAVIAILVHNLVSVNLRWTSISFHFWLFLGMILSYHKHPEPHESRAGAFPQKGQIATCASLLILSCIGWYRLSLQPLQSEFATMRGYHWHKRGKSELAEGEFRSALGVQAENVRAAYYLAATLFQQKRYEDAIGSYRSLQRFNPDYAQVHYNLAACYLSIRDWDNAAKEFVLQGKLGGLPKQQLESMLRVLKRRGGKDKYAQTLADLVKMNPDSVLTRNMLGNHFFKSGRFADAGIQYEAILTLDPSNIEALNNLAGVYFMKQQPSKAEDICRQILQINHDEAIPWINLGKACYMQGKKSKAREAWKTAQRLSPDNREAKQLLETLK